MANFRRFFTLILFLGLSGHVLGSTNRWTGAAGDGYWANSSNWSLGAAPGSADVVVIDSTTNNILLNLSAQVSALTLGSDQGLASLIVTNGQLTCSGPALIHTNGVMNLSGALTLETSLQLDGVLNLAGAALFANGPVAVGIGPAGTLNFTATGSNVFWGKVLNLGTISCWGNVYALSFSRITNANVLVLHTNVVFADPYVGSGGSQVALLLNQGTILASNDVSVLFRMNLTNSGRIYAGTNTLLQLEKALNQLTVPSMAFLTGTVFEGPGTNRLTALSSSPQFSGDILINGRLETLIGDYPGISTWAGTGTVYWLSGVLAPSTIAENLQVIKVPNSPPGAGPPVIEMSCTNRGTIIFSGTNAPIHWRSPVWNEGLVIFEHDLTIDNDGHGEAAFINRGQILAPPNSSVSLNIIPHFTNYGAVTAETNASLTFAEGYPYIPTFADGSKYEGDGVVRIASRNAYVYGNLVINGTLECAKYSSFLGNVTLNGVGTLRLAGGVSGTFGPGLHVDWIDGQCGVLTNYATLRVVSGGLKVVGAVFPNLWTTFVNYGQVLLMTNTFFEGSAAYLAFLNYGEVATPDNSGPLSLTLALFSYFTNYGVVRVGANSSLKIGGDGSAPFHDYDNTFTAEDGSAFLGRGTISLALPNLRPGKLFWRGAIELDCTLELNDYLAEGAAVFNGPGLFRWNSGGLSGVTFGPSLHAEIETGNSKQLCGVWTNLGTLTCAGSVGPSTNCASAFYNGGQVVFTTGQTWSAYIPIVNLPGAAMSFDGGGSGILALGPLTNAGRLDLARGTLQCSGPLTLAPSSELRATLGGAVAGINFPTISTAGGALDGALKVSLTNGFVPGMGSRFQLASGPSWTGQFATADFPSLPELYWGLDYAPAGIGLRVEATSLSVYAPSVAGDGTFRFSLSGPAASGWTVEASTNLADWELVQSNTPFSGHANFADTNARSFSVRFYRVQLVD